MRLSILFFLVLSFKSFSFTPQDFSLPPSIGGSAIFVDFLTAKYDLIYDVAKKKATYKAIITFDQKSYGKPIFDVVNKPTAIKLNNDFVRDIEISSPYNETKMRILDIDNNPGRYTLEVQGEIQNLVQFTNTSVSAAHWTNDLEDRGFLESYLPTNFEFDQYTMTFHVSIKGTQTPHRVYANGTLTSQSNQLEFTLSYPNYFTSSSGFYHIAPIDDFEERRFQFTSINGNILPVLIYGKSRDTDFNKFKNITIKTLRELEQDYGPFPHPQVVIYNNGKGGMEYCGATMTDLWALEHELTHSYFARGLMPANGNAGWIDEAIASWRDNDYPRSESLQGSSSMSSHAYYTRYTDSLAYSFGVQFMAYLDGKIAKNSAHEGLKTFLKHAREKYIFKPYSVENFVSWMEDFYNLDFQNDFKTYTYEKKNLPFKKFSFVQPIGSKFFHRKFSLKELTSFL